MLNRYLGIFLEVSSVASKFRTLCGLVEFAIDCAVCRTVNQILRCVLVTAVWSDCECVICDKVTPCGARDLKKQE